MADARFPGVALGSLTLASAPPQAKKVRGYAAKGKVQDDEWSYESTASQIGNFAHLLFIYEQLPSGVVLFTARFGRPAKSERLDGCFIYGTGSCHLRSAIVPV